MCSVLKQEVVDPEVVVGWRDQHVGSGLVQHPAQEVPPSAPLLKLLLTVSEVTARSISTALIQPGTDGEAGSREAMGPGQALVLSLSAEHSVLVFL